MVGDFQRDAPVLESTASRYPSPFDPSPVPKCPTNVTPPAVAAEPEQQIGGQCWWYVYFPVCTFRDVKLPVLLIGVEPSDTPRRAAPRPPNSVGTCDAAGICSKPVARPVTPHVIIECVSGSYALAGQSIISNGVTTY